MCTCLITSLLPNKTAEEWRAVKVILVNYFDSTGLRKGFSLDRGALWPRNGMPVFMGRLRRSYGTHSSWLAATEKVAISPEVRGWQRGQCMLHLVLTKNRLRKRMGRCGIEYTLFKNHPRSEPRSGFRFPPKGENFGRQVRCSWLCFHGQGMG